MTFGVNNLPSRPYHGGRRVPRRSRRKVVTQFENVPAGREQQIPRPANPSGAQKARCARDNNVALESGFKLSDYERKGGSGAIPRLSECFLFALMRCRRCDGIAPERLRLRFGGNRK